MKHGRAFLNGPARGGLRVLAALALLLLSTAAWATVELTLTNEFIEAYKNRATIETTFTVDKAHERPNPPKKDGDLHAAGRAPEVKLPIVVEVMNAKYEDRALEIIHEAEESGNPIKVEGAWRLWSEHGGDSVQKQGAALQPFKSSNPDHVFEIHPVTKVKNEDVRDSLKPIRGFRYKDAERAFHFYENVKCDLQCNKKTTTLTTGMAGYNYVDFVIELNENPTHMIEDGLTVMAAVLDEDGELLVRNVRMVLIEGTEPYQVVKEKGKGERLRVLGIPRIDLAIVSWRCKNASQRPEVLDWNLPYEMILVAVLE